MKIVASNTQQTQPAPPKATQGASQNADVQFPDALTSLLFPPSAKVSAGTEPPFLEMTKDTAAQEAAEEPNADSQKLDTGRREPKSEKKVVKAAINPISNSLVESRTQIVTQPAPALSKDSAVVAKTSIGANSISSTSAKVASAPNPAPAEASVPDKTAKPPTPPAQNMNTQSPETSNPALPQDDQVKVVGVQVQPEVAAKAAVALKADDVSLKQIIKDPAHSTLMKIASGPGTINHSSGSGSSATGQGFGQAGSDLSNTSNSAKVEKPASLTEVQGLNRTELVGKVVSNLDTMLASRPRGTVTIQLAPKALGDITLTLKTTGKSIDTQIAASNADVRTALEKSKPELIEAMQSRGYTVSNLSFSSDSQNSSGQGQNQTRQNSESAQSKRPLFDPRPAPEVMPSSATRFKAGAGVDVWI